MRYIYFLCLGFFQLLVTTEVAFAALHTTAFVVGTNQSTRKDLKPLRYATADAQKVVAALREVGYVDNIVESENPTLSQFREQFQDALKKTKETASPDKPNRFILYFSGHADDDGLHFRDGIFPKQELHNQLAAVPATTKITILDTCFSGSITAKGAVAAKAFELPKVQLDSPTGSVFLTASSGKQLAYESESFKGGIFTHHLIDGLYGKADGNSDGLVTIDELYQYVYKTTRWQSLGLPTASTQDPEFRSELKGQGAVVMSFPMRHYAQVEILPDLMGTISIASDRGMLFYKYEKDKGDTKKIRLPIGQYQVSIAEPNRMGKGKLEVKPNRMNLLASNHIAWADGVSPEVTFSKGMEQTDTSHTSNTKWSTSVFLGGHVGYISGSEFGPYMSIGMQRRSFTPADSMFQIRFGAELMGHQNRKTLDDETQHVTTAVAAFGNMDMRLHVFATETATDLYVKGGFGQGHFDQRQESQSDANLQGAGAHPLLQMATGIELFFDGESSFGAEIGYHQIYAPTYRDINGKLANYGALKLSTTLD